MSHFIGPHSAVQLRPPPYIWLQDTITRSSIKQCTQRPEILEFFRFYRPYSIGLELIVNCISHVHVLVKEVFLVELLSRVTAEKAISFFKGWWTNFDWRGSSGWTSKQDKTCLRQVSQWMDKRRFHVRQVWMARLWWHVSILGLMSTWDWMWGPCQMSPSPKVQGEDRIFWNISEPKGWRDWKLHSVGNLYQLSSTLEPDPLSNRG